jgi:hypothetical protein
MKTYHLPLIRSFGLPGVRPFVVHNFISLQDSTSQWHGRGEKVLMHDTQVYEAGNTLRREALEDEIGRKETGDGVRDCTATTSGGDLFMPLCTYTISSPAR